MQPETAAQIERDAILGIEWPDYSSEEKSFHSSIVDQMKRHEKAAKERGQDYRVDMNWDY